MVRVHWTTDLLEAEVICGFLREHGIAADVFDRDLVRQNWLQTLAFGGFRVVAPREQAAEAASLMQRWRAGEFSLQPDTVAAVDESTTCPACGSADTGQDTRSRRTAFASLILLGLPLPWSRRKCRCAACGHRWQEMTQESFAQLAHRADDHSASA